MPTRPPASKKHTVLHADGSLWAAGNMVGETMTGYWKWFRKDGTKMRSGFFEDGKQVGTWTTNDKKGEVYKVTGMKPASGSRV